MYYKREGLEMTISLRLAEEESNLIKSYAALHGISVSELVRQAVLERIEDEYDLQIFDEAMKKHRKNPVIYTHDELCEMLEKGE
jgi:RHH-type transcriptional regulator, rel operon repressor / antitoxin RelB